MFSPLTSLINLHVYLAQLECTPISSTLITALCFSKLVQRSVAGTVAGFRVSIKFNRD